MMYRILTKNERNTPRIVYILSEFHSFFGKIKDTIICFRDLLTFNNLLTLTFLNQSKWVNQPTKTHFWVNYILQWWVEFDDELSWLFTNRLSATRYMKIKRMGITEILRRIWLFSAIKIKISESFSKQPT